MLCEVNIFSEIAKIRIADVSRTIRRNYLSKKKLSNEHWAPRPAPARSLRQG